MIFKDPIFEKIKQTKSYEINGIRQNLSGSICGGSRFVSLRWMPKRPAMTIFSIIIKQATFPNEIHTDFFTLKN